jgi:chitin disaccharide deacetylase
LSAIELIVNADDFGRSVATNEGIVRAHEHGIVTSASLMVRWAAATDAADYARAHPELSVGLHFDLCEWEYRDDEWVLVYENQPAERELGDQLARFRALMNRDPTHLDSHQHVHRDQPLASLMAALAEEIGVPLRESGQITYNGGFYGQSGKGDPYPEGVGVASLVGMIDGLQPGITEFGCHPGLDLELDSSYRLERLGEVETLCDPRVLAAVQRKEVRLRGFEGRADR